MGLDNRVCELFHKFPQAYRTLLTFWWRTLDSPRYKTLTFWWRISAFCTIKPHQLLKNTAPPRLLLKGVPNMHCNNKPPLQHGKPLPKLAHGKKNFLLWKRKRHCVPKGLTTTKTNPAPKFDTSDLIQENSHTHRAPNKPYRRTSLVPHSVPLQTLEPKR